MRVDSAVRSSYRCRARNDYSNFQCHIRQNALHWQLFIQATLNTGGYIQKHKPNQAHSHLYLGFLEAKRLANFPVIPAIPIVIDMMKSSRYKQD